MSNPPTVVGGSIPSSKGGTLDLDPEKPMAAPGGVQATDYGAAFGPLEVIAYPDSEVRIGGLQFKGPAGILEGIFGDGGEGDSLFGLLPFVAAGSVANHHRRDGESDNRLGRRDLLRTAAAGGLLLGGSQAVAAASTTQTRAQFAVLENPSGIRVRVDDRVEGYLPTSAQYYTFVNNERYSKFTAANSESYGDVLPKQTGTVVVGPSGASGGLLARIGSEKTQVYEGLSLSKAVSDAEVGENITITENDIIVEHVQSAGASETTCAINGTSIPHEHEDSQSDRGYYGIHNGKLIYQKGPSAPTGQTATVVLYAETVDEILDDVSRGV